MKYYKRKQVARFTLFGVDDEKFVDDTSFIFNTANITANVNDYFLIKDMTFNIQGMPNTELSNNAMLVLESVFLRNKIVNINENLYTGEVIIRCNNLNNTAMWDSTGKRNKPVILWNGGHTNDTVWTNPAPDILYNFPVPRNFLQSSQIELSIEMLTELSIFDINAFYDLALSFVVYDYDVEEVKGMGEIDFQRMFQGREPNAFGGVAR